jgi:thioredoxin-related protein
MFLSNLKIMKLNIKTCVALATFQCVAAVFAGGEGWTSDFAAAKKEAASSKKDLLMDFTGSDWCGWCIKLDKEVFSKDTFKTGVKDKFVLVDVDFPKNKTKLSKDTIAQNAELEKQYNIQGYPTIMLCDADGKPFAATGYEEGGAESYVKHLEELRGNKKVRDDFFAIAKKSQGVEKAKALVAALKAMNLDDMIVANFYGDIAKQIKAADPKDETGYAKGEATKARLQKFNDDLDGLTSKGDFNGALKLLDDELKVGGYSPEITQQMIVTRGKILAELKRYDEAGKAFDDAKAIAPDSEVGKAMNDFKAQIEKAKRNVDANATAPEDAPKADSK